MEKVADTYHLQRRGESWYYYRRVPSELVEAVGKAIIKQSLKTASKSEAKRQRSILDVEMDQWFAKLRGQSESAAFASQKIAVNSERRLPLDQLIEHLRDLVEAEDSASKERLVADPPTNDEELIDLQADAEIALQIMRNPADDRQQQEIIGFGKRVLSRAKALSPVSNDVAAFDALTRRGLIELSRRRIARYEDRYVRGWFDEMFDPSRPKPVNIQSLAEDYVEERRIEYDLNAVSAKRMDKVQSQVNTLVEIIGSHHAVTDIGDEAVQKVRQILAGLPANRSKLYPGLSPEESVNRANMEGRKMLSPITQQQYLDDLRGLLSLAVRRKLLSSNPAASVRPLKKETRAAHEKRLPFSKDQLKLFFTSDFYRSCAPNSCDPYLTPTAASHRPLRGSQRAPEGNQVGAHIPSDCCKPLVDRKRLRGGKLVEITDHRRRRYRSGRSPGGGVRSVAGRPQGLTCRAG